MEIYERFEKPSKAPFQQQLLAIGILVHLYFVLIMFLIHYLYGNIIIRGCVAQLTMTETSSSSYQAVIIHYINRPTVSARDIVTCKKQRSVFMGQVVSPITFWMFDVSKKILCLSVKYFSTLSGSSLDGLTNHTTS